jgi:hypothetical protein
MNQMSKDINLVEKVDQIMITRAKLYMGIIIFMVPIVGFFFKIQLDVALIKQNHEAHMQAALERIAEIEEENVDLENKLDVDHEAIIKLLTLVDK